MLGELSNTELAALAACDKRLGVSTEGYIPGKVLLDSLVERGLLRVVKTEIVGGWRQYEWYKTTADGKKAYLAELAPTGK